MTQNNRYVRKNAKLSVDSIYILLFSFYILYSLMNATMFYLYLPNLSGVFRILSVLLAVISLFRNKSITIYYIIWTILIVLSVLFVSIFTNYGNVATIFCFILAARSVDFDKIANSFTVISLFVITVTIIASQVGIIENLRWHSSTTVGRYRYGLGFTYPTDFVAIVFFTICVIIYLNRFRRFQPLLVVAFIAAGIATYEFCLTRLDSLCIIIATLDYIYLSFRKKNKPIGAIKKILYCSTIPLCATISILLSVLYDPSVPVFNALNTLLSDRLELGNRAINRYGFSFFGQDVFMKGYSARSFNVVGDYFYIDCSYLNIAIRYGVVTLVIICGMFMFLSYRQLCDNDVVIPSILLIIAINSMIAQHFFDGYTNVFIYALLANISNEEGKRRAFQRKKKIRFRIKRL